MSIPKEIDIMITPHLEVRMQSYMPIPDKKEADIAIIST